jgi:hypothetical protein
MNQSDMKKREGAKKKLLEHYGKKNPSDFIQYDAFVNPKWHDSVIQPNPASGVCVLSGTTTELMDTCNEVRILISKEATKSQVLRGIKEIFEDIKTQNCRNQQSLFQAFNNKLEFPF